MVATFTALAGVEGDLLRRYADCGEGRDRQIKGFLRPEGFACLSPT